MLDFHQAKKILVLRSLTILGLGFTMMGCSSVNEDYNAAKKHHRPDGFQNNYTDATDKSRGEMLKWFWLRQRDGLPKPPEQQTPVVAPDLAFVQSNRGKSQEPAIT